MVWVQLLWKFKGPIAIGAVVLFVILYIVSLKSEIGDLKGVVADYKIEMNDANNDIKRLSGVNIDYVKSHERAIIDYEKMLETCAERMNIFGTKEDEYLDLIESLRNKKPKKVITTVYKLQECAVTVVESNDKNASTLINRLNSNFGGQ